MRSQRQHEQTYSVEFFPPKTEKGREKLRSTRERLGKLKPRFFSVTFGAGGTTQEGTYETVLETQQSGFEAAPHLSCIGSTKENIRKILANYQAAGISHLVALRGDLPSGMGQSAGEFRHANELVEFIRQETDDHFFIEVAAYPEFHPQAPSADTDLENFKRKVDAGANSAITQYFFNADAYFYFIDRCEKMGVDLPVVPGIMPITNYTQLARFSEGCGAEIPRWLRWRLQQFGDDLDSLKAFGIDFITQMSETLLNAGAPGLHFYTLNQAEATEQIWRNLKLPC